MTRIDLDKAYLERACLGDREAMDFLLLWNRYVHEIDDILDGDADSAEDILRTFARAAMLYSHPFYLKNIAALRQVVLIVTNAYADSVAWEKSGVEWKRNWADHNRHAGLEMVLAVAMILGGYDHARAISPEQREICQHDHHDQDGEPN